MPSDRCILIYENPMFAYVAIVTSGGYPDPISQNPLMKFSVPLFGIQSEPLLPF